MAFYKEYIGLKSIFYFCSLPLRLDTYKGCRHACLYCFSQTLNNRANGFFSTITPANPDVFDHLIKYAISSNNHSSLVTSCLRRKVPIHLGCVSDPFQQAEATYHVTRHFLRTLARYQYPTVISTKSDMVAQREFLSIFKDMSLTIQISFSSLNDNLASKLEPNAPLPSKRLEAIEKLSAHGIRTVARIQPFLYPFEQLNENIFRILANSGIKHVLLEHLRIPTNSSLKSRKKLSTVLGADILETYKSLGLKHSRVNYELASQVKLPNVIYARLMAHTFGMTFGAADNDFHHFSDYLCCCGIPPTQEFSAQYSGHLGRGLFDSLRSGIIDFGYIDNEWHPEGSTREFINSDCRQKGLSSVQDLLKDRINKPRSSNSPLSFYGVICTKDGYQMDPNIIKEFNNRGGSDG